MTSTDIKNAIRTLNAKIGFVEYRTQCESVRWMRMIESNQWEDTEESISLKNWIDNSNLSIKTMYNEMETLETQLATM